MNFVEDESLCSFSGLYYDGQSNENRTPAATWQWNLLYSKVIARSVNTFIPLGDETINSSLVERGRSLMDPQLHPLLHFVVRKKPTSTNETDVHANIEMMQLLFNQPLYNAKLIHSFYSTKFQWYSVNSSVIVFVLKGCRTKAMKFDEKKLESVPWSKE